jgi:UDP-2,3-diacylglucosamine pyrophosphatase LpxH
MALPTSLLDRPSHVDTAETDAAIPGGIRGALLPLALGAPLDSLIVSDLHLGLRGSRSAELLKLLQMLRFDRLVLLGDILHDATLRRLSRDDWALIAFLRQLRHRPDAPAVLPVLGNHDRSCGDLLARLLDRPVTDSVTWTHAGRRYLAVHGDLFDRFITRNRRTAQAVSALFGFCHRRLSRDGSWPHAADQLHVRWTGLGRKMAEAALAHARSHGADVIFCGHSHQPDSRFDLDGGRSSRPLTYLNTGAWLGLRPSFVTVAGDGSARLHQFA